jgi:hypothetical protein
VVNSSISVNYADAGVTAEPAFTGTWTLGAFTADVASSSSIGLTTAGWSVDQWAGAWVEILTGPAAGQTRLVQANMLTGIGATLAISGSPGSYTVTLTSAGTPGFTTALIGKTIRILGATTSAHNGVFTITGVPLATQLTWINTTPTTPPGSEIYTGTWTISDGTRIIPVRNFSTSPGTGAKFRFVRPKTQLTNDAFLTLDTIGSTSSGGFGSIAALQYLSLDWSFTQVQMLSSNTFQYLSAVFCNSRTAIPVITHGAATLVINGTKWNPHTFAGEVAAINPAVGCSAFNRLVPGGATYSGFLLRGLSALQVNQSFLPLLMIVAPMTDLYLVRQGTRALHCALIQCHGEGMANLFTATSGFASTKFGNHPSKAIIPGIYMEGSRLGGFGAVNISGWNDHGIVMNMSSTLYINGVATGVMGRSGLYIHAGSICEVKGGITPTLTGTVLGNITVDDATTASTWAAISAGTPMVAGSELSLVKSFTNIYGL